MIDLLRRITDHWLTKTLLGVLALVFILFFSTSGMLGSSDPALVMVNGRAIRTIEINVLERELGRQMQRGGKSLTEAQRAQVRDDAIERAVNTELLTQEAKSMGLVVSDAEVRDAILQVPEFQGEGGKFSKALYDERVASRGAASYERGIRENLLLQSVSEFVARSVVVTEAEVRDAWEAESATRELEFVRVSSASFRDGITLSDTDVSAWAGAHEAEVKARYDRDYETVYKQPRKVHGRHILMKYEDADDEQVRAEIRRRMDAVLAEARAPGADFEALARKYSEDASASRGGDLGFFDETKMVEPFTKAAFALPVGGISDVVESKFGLHVIQVVEVQEAKDQGLDEVRSEIARTLMLDEKAPEAARAYADRLRTVLDGSAGVEGGAAILAEKGVAIEETGPFSRADRRVPKVPGGPEVLQAAFALDTVGQVSTEPVSTGTGWAVFKLRSRKDADPAAFDGEREALTQRVRFLRQQRSFEGWLASLKAKASIERLDR